MTTTAAISPVIRNVLSVAKIPPMAVNASQMARITPRIVHIIRPMYSVCARHLSGIVTSTVPGLPAGDLCADDHADRWQAPADYEPAQG